MIPAPSIQYQGPPQTGIARVNGLVAFVVDGHEVAGYATVGSARESLSDMRDSFDHYGLTDEQFWLLVAAVAQENLR